MSLANEMIARSEETGGVIPSNIYPGALVQMAADNNDVNEETTDGKNTTHTTTLVVYQRKQFCPERVSPSNTRKPLSQMKIRWFFNKPLWLPLKTMCGWCDQSSKEKEGPYCLILSEKLNSSRILFFAKKELHLADVLANGVLLLSVWSIWDGFLNKTRCSVYDRVPGSAWLVAPLLILISFRFHLPRSSYRPLVEKCSLPIGAIGKGSPPTGPVH